MVDSWWGRGERERKRWTRTNFIIFGRTKRSEEGALEEMAIWLNRGSTFGPVAGL
jgi:hypothetical protein